MKKKGKKVIHEGHEGAQRKAKSYNFLTSCFFVSFVDKKVFVFDLFFVDKSLFYLSNCPWRRKCAAWRATWRLRMIKLWLAGTTIKSAMPSIFVRSTATRPS